jgi:hypothetical protein
MSLEEIYERIERRLEKKTNKIINEKHCRLTEEMEERHKLE